MNPTFAPTIRLPIIRAADPKGACQHPELDVRIWRYMSRAKFSSLLEKKALYFCPASHFGDPFEGNRTAAQIAETARLMAALAPSGRDASKEFYAQVRAATVVNCWHINSHENEGMWNRYAAQGKGVAISSRFGRLLDAFPQGPPETPWFSAVIAGLVSYVDHKTDPVIDFNFLRPLLLKRREYEHERELRLLHHEQPNYVKYPHGAFVMVDLAQLIESVHLPPKSSAGDIEALADELKRAGLDIAVVRSRLDEPPDF